MHKIFFIILFLPLCSMAQSDSSRFGYGGGFSVDWTYRILQSEDAILKENFDTLESADWGYTIRFSAHYKLSQKLHLTTGLGFARRGIQIDTLAVADTKDLIDRFSQVEIPVGMRYSLIKREKYSFHIGGGIFASYLVKHNGRFQELRRETEYSYSNTEEFNRIGVGAFGALGFVAALNNRVSMVIDASFRQSFTAIAEGPLARKLNATGLGLSIIHDF